MNQDTGEVRLLDECEKLPIGWTSFTIGEIIEVKGIKFHVHDVSDQRLVLKFTK